MNNISSIRNCYGCGVCATVCSKKIIQIILNKDGFYEPLITNENQCTNCGICINICAYSHDILSLKKPLIRSYAAWSKDSKVRKKCSSGGVGFELGRSLLSQGYKVCAVRYDAEAAKAEHYIATTVEELILSIGSKYIQSYTVDGFKDINRKEKYLVTGTPCQIDSFRRYIQKFKVEDNFVLMDFFCHSVPSIWAWHKYLQIVERTIGKVTYASWRNKFTGWHDSWAILINGRKKNYSSRLSQGDIFYNLFLGDYYCNPACRKSCKYKYDRSSADIRIGDLWGDTYKDNEDGVSALIAFTEKGNKVIKEMQTCTLIEHPFEVVAEGQMKKNCKKAYTANIVQYLLKRKHTFHPFVWKSIFKLEQICQLPKRVVNKMKHLR